MILAPFRAALAVVADALRVAPQPERVVPPSKYTGPRRLRIPGMTPTAALHRFSACVGTGTYVLGTGGRNPDAPAPWTSKGARIGSDCVGAFLWAWGIDRFQPSFPLYGGWINTDSAIGEARTTAQWFRIVEHPEPGDAVVFPSVDFDHDGDRDRIGHIGMVSFVPRLWDGDFADLRVIHCAASGRVAVRESSGGVWNNRDMFKGRRNPKWSSLILRVVT